MQQFSFNPAPFNRFQTKYINILIFYKEMSFTQTNQNQWKFKPLWDSMINPWAAPSG